MANTLDYGSAPAVVEENDSSGEASERFTRLTGESQTSRLSARKVPPFDLHATVEVISESRTQIPDWAIAEQDTRPTGGKAGLNGASQSLVSVPAFDVRKSANRIPTRELLMWTLVDGHMALDRELPSGMALDLLLDGCRSKWRLVRGSCPRDEVLRGV